ncbi:endolytic transglycosylase MltG [Haloglycomyces albus]|uniref:endolytic transglycosylase MltG n=1 Tax=Haloglycomyces albus TaxID=526067 RepID=UPI00046D6E14|nr:endolytic transglycosylase MltG [Haloglycomyces albus]
MLDEFTSERDDNEPRRHRKKESKSSVVAMALVVVLLGAVGFGGWWGYNHFVKGMFSAEDYSGDGNGTLVQIEIKQGQSVADIGNLLYDEGVVASSQAFVNASEENNDLGTTIHAGVYELEEEMSAEAALEILADPDNVIVEGAVTINEGWRTVRIYNVLSEETGIPVEEFEKAAEDPVDLGVNPMWFENLDDGVTMSIEGFLFPATYDFSDSKSAQEVLATMVARFNQEVEDLGFMDRAVERDIEPWMALQIASIVQYESGIPEDDAKIARVFYNRLYGENALEQIGCRCLQTDASISYGHELETGEVKGSNELTNEELNDPDNEWSTASNEGYMPTAISNPGRAALEAAVEPADGDWLYFVTAEEDGSALFAETNAEHEENKQVARENGIID